MRAKFQLQAIEYTGGDPEDPNTQATYTFRASWDPAIPENERFNRATPWGELKMVISNPAVKHQLKINQYYYLDFTPAE